MRVSTVSFCLALAAATGCAPYQNASPSDRQADDRAMAWPKDWSEHLGQTVTLEGAAHNLKLGALLVGDAGRIWIDGLDEWPAGYYSGGDQGKRLRVTGTVIKRDDMPAFVQKPGELPRAGIPVQSDEELEKAKWRFLLKDAKWTVLD
jgi:hypothetical protein